MHSFYSIRLRTFPRRGSRTAVRLLSLLLGLPALLGALAVHADVGVNKSFNPIAVSAGQVSTLTISLLNANAAAATGTTLTDALPAGLVIAAPLNASTTCAPGTVSAVAGGTSVTLNNGTIPAAGVGLGQCVIMVDVLSSIPSSYINNVPIGAVSSSQGSNTQNAQATLTVVALAPVAGSKAFAPANLHGNGVVSKLTITLPNSNGVALTNVAFTDTLPAQLAVATPPNLSTTCVPGTPASTTGSVSLSGATLPANGSCTISVDVIAKDPTAFFDANATNTVAAGALTSAEGASNSGFSNTVRVQTGAQVTKGFAPNPIITGGTSTLTVTIRNFNASALTPITLTDTLPAGMTAVGPASTNCAGGAASFTAGSVSITGGSLAAAAAGIGSTSCTLTVVVTATNATVNPITLTNSIPAGNFAGINYPVGTGTLTVNPPSNIVGSKVFTGALLQTGVMTMTVTLNNVTGTAASISAFTDNLTTMGAGFTVAASPLPSTTCVGGIVNAPAGGTLITMSSGLIPANGSCTIVVPVQVGPNAPTGNRTNTIAPNAVVTSQGNNILPITGTANIARALDLAKSFAPATVFAGSNSRLTITFTRRAGASALSGLSVTDTLPAGHVIALPPTASTTCGGAVTAIAGANSVALTGGALAGGALATSCTVQVDVTTPGGSSGTGVNTIPANAVTTTEGVTNIAASANLARVTSVVSLSKGFSPDTVVIGGTSTMSVGILNTNPGAVNLTNVAISDSLPLGMIVATPPVSSFSGPGCSGGTLTAVAASASVQLTGATVNANAACLIKLNVVAMAAGNLINNIATGALSDSQGVSNLSPVTATLASTGTANLGITKTDGLLQAVPGTSVTYTIVASNAGPNSVAGANVVDNPPAGMTFTSWTCTASAGSGCPASGSGPIAALVSLLNGGTATFIVTANIAPNATGTISNTATFVTPGSVVDPDTSNNSATDTDTLTSQADIQAVKTGTVSVVYGGALSYTVVVTNNGPSDANGTTFTDNVPAAITGVSASCGSPTSGAVCGTVNVAGNNVTSTITTLPSGGSVTFTITGTAPTSGLSVTNSATANPPVGTTDPVTTNNTGTATTNLLQPHLVVTKTATPNPFTVGQAASYAITVANNGAGPTAGNVVVTDTLPSGITLASIVGANWSCTGTTALICTYTGTIAAPGSTTLTLNVTIDASATTGNNSATASGGGDPTCLAAGPCTGTVTVPVSKSADIAVSKSVDNATPNVGENVTFTVTAKNNGPNDATGVAITDALPSGLQYVSSTPSQGTYVQGTGVWTVGALANGISATLQITVTVLTPGAITNTATKTAGDQFDPNTGNNAGSAMINANPSADLQVTKLVNNATPNLGTNVTFTITVHNAGPNDATGVVIDDALPLGLNYVSSTTSQGTYVSGTGVWTVGGILNGADATLTLTATVTLPGDITNIASVAASDQHDPNSANNSGGATENGQSSDIQVVKGVDNANPIRGNTVTFTITATNNGPSNATGVAITDALPAGLTFVSATAAAGTAYNNGTGVWTIGAMAATGPGATKILTIVATVDTDSGFTNTAALSAIDQTDTNPSNNSDSVVVTPIASADLSITKTDGATTAVPGSPVTYTIVASNAGPSAVTGATVIDTLPTTINSVTWTCATCVPNSGAGDINTLVDLAAGGSATIIVTGTIDPTATGTLTNTATITAPAGVTDPPGNNSATDTDTLVPTADISVLKTGPANATAGQNVSYTLAVTNNGPSDAQTVSLADPAPAGLAFVSASAPCAAGFPCALGTLANGATTNVTVVFSVPPSYAGASIVNTATVSSPTADPTPGNNSSTVTTPTAASSNISVIKTGPANATAGQNVSYTLAVTNNGPSDAQTVSLADPPPAGLTFISASAPCAAGFPCALGTLANGASVNVTVTFSVPAGATGSITNTATVTSPTPDPTPGDNSSTVVTPIVFSADVEVVKTGPAAIVSGQNASYTIAVTNHGPSAAANVSLADPAPAGLSFVSASAPCAGGFPCNLGTMASGATVNLTVVFAVPADYAGASVTNVASATSTTQDPNANNNSSTVVTPTSTSADVEVVKSGPASASAGQNASYTIAVTNHGPSDALAVSLLDPTPAGLNFVSASAPCASGFPCALGTLNVGQTVNITVTFAVPSSYSGANITNIASASSTTPDPDTGNNSSTVVTPVTASADIVVVKTGPASVNSGAAIGYTVVVSNAGPSDADGASFSDPVPAGISGVTATCGAATLGAACGTVNVAGNTVTSTITSLPAGSSVTFTIGGTAPFGAQTLINTATSAPPSGVSDTNPANNSSSASTTVGGAADIGLTKNVDNSAPNVGDTVVFTIIATNHGPNDASGVGATDSLPAGFGFVSAAASQGTYVNASGLWTIGNLANGASATLTITATVDVPGALTNTVAVSASDQPDPDTSNNNAGASINSGATADIGIAKSVDNASPNVGSTVTYTITATNHGPNDATGVEATDHLPAGTSFVGATPSQGTYDDVGGVWTIGALTNGAMATLTITVNVDQPGSITNSVTITHEDQFDPVGANNQAGTTINGQQADLAVTKTVDNATPNVGQNVTFTVSVHNNGPSAATNVAITDQLPLGLTFASATPSQGTYSSATGIWTIGALGVTGAGSSATLSIVATVAQAGAIVNTASVSASDQLDPNTANNSGSASLNGNPQADLEVDKSGPATVTPGNDVVYTVVLTNHGPSNATNIVVVDATPAGLVFVSNAGACATAYPCSIAAIASGASVTITSTYTVPAAYSGANPIINTASATSDTPDPDTTNNQSSVQTNIGPGNADVAIVKTAPVTVASGGSIAYTLTISNNGPSPANGASYVDNVPAGITAITASCAGATGGAACGTQPAVAGNAVTGTVGSLPSGGAVVITINGTAPSGPVTLSNTASVTAPAGVNDTNPANNNSTVRTDVAALSADLSVVKSGPANAAPGTNVTYTLTVTNAGPDAATNVVLNDATPAGLSFVSASLPCAAGFPCSLGTMPAGGSTIVAVTFAVPVNASGSIVNIATVGSDTPDPNPSDNSSTVTTPLVPVTTSADLAVVKSGPASVTAGTNAVYTLLVTNNGPDVATSIVLADPTPAGVTFVSADGPCTGGFPCALGTLANGASVSVNVTFAVPVNASAAIVNTASVNSATPDPNGSNNSSTVTTTVVPVTAASADLVVTKTGPATVAGGGTISYTIVVANNGPDAVPDAVLSDSTPPGLTFVSASPPCSGGFPCTIGAIANGASVTITTSYAVAAGFAGSITNIASAHSTTVPDPTPNNNSSTVATTVTGAPAGEIKPVPVDARWMLALMTLMLMLVGAPLTKRRR